MEEGLGGVDRGLADHGVDDEQDLVGLDRGANVRGLLHEVLVDRQAAGRVDDDDGVAVSYTHLRAHETVLDIVCRLLLEKKKYSTTDVILSLNYDYELENVQE